MPTPEWKLSRHNTRQDGVTLLETMIALAIITPMALMGAHQYMQYQDRQLAATAATQQMAIAEAARNYLTDNYAEVNAALNGSSGEYLDELIADGYLDQTQFGGSGAFNPFGQEYRVYYYQGTNPTDPIETLVIARGVPSTSRNIQHTMNRHMGVTSAYVGESGLESSFYENVSYDLGRFGESAAAEGSIAFFDTLERQAAASDYLYRHSVAGFPELNRMQTDLDMDGNSIVNADRVNAEALNAAQVATIGEGANTVTTQNGNIVATGDVTAEGTSYAQRFMNPSNPAFRFDPAGTDATSNVHGLTVGADRGDRLVAGGYLRLASHGDSAGSSCPQQGLVTVDNSGMLLSCQSGSWEALSGTSITTVSRTVARTTRARIDASVSCPSHRTVISGGCHVSDRRYVITSDRASGNGWSCLASENWGTSSAAISVSLTAYAYCGI